MDPEGQSVLILRMSIPGTNLSSGWIEPTVNPPLPLIVGPTMHLMIYVKRDYSTVIDP